MSVDRCSPELRFDNGRAALATTWVCKTPAECLVPYAGDALAEAVRRGMHVALHLESRSILVHFEQPQPGQRVQGKLATVLGKGGAMRKCIDEVEAFDLYHAELWGLLPIRPPPLPEQSEWCRFGGAGDDELLSTEEDQDLSSGCESDLEQDDEEGGGEQAEAGGNEIVCGDLFRSSLPRAANDHSLPDALEALGMESASERGRRAAFTARGGPLSPYLQEALLSRGRPHVREVQEEALATTASARGPLRWVTGVPGHLTVCGKPNMRSARRVEWIAWRAERLGLDLTPPVFMALFKQVTFFADKGVRLQRFKAAVEQWQGAPLRWKSLSVETRRLVMSVNNGRSEFNCTHCGHALDPDEPRRPFCGPACASLYCSCGTKYAVRRVTDYDRLEVLHSRAGPLFHLLELARLLDLRTEVERFEHLVDVDEAFVLLEDLRRRTRCCPPPPGFFDGQRCARCEQEQRRLVEIQRGVWLIRSGQVSWGHCEEAALRLQKLGRMPLPLKDELFCEACRPGRRPTRLSSASGSR